MAYVPVPKDLSKIKTKLAFNLTKRQLVCFSSAAAVGLPAYLFSLQSTMSISENKCRTSCGRFSRHSMN